MGRTALDIVKDYVGKAWNEGQAHLVRELCANPIIRHDPNSRVQLSHDEQEARIRHSYDDLETKFDNVVFHGDDEYVTLVWDVVGRDPKWKLCGIEVFRVVAERITEVWNLPYSNGHWSMSKSLAAQFGEGPRMAIPVLDVETSENIARVTVPLDARNFGRWLRAIMGEPESRGHGDGLWQHRFTNGEKSPFSIDIDDAKGPGRRLEDARVERMSLELVPEIGRAHV
mgnify:CR=1 FL=1